MTQFTEGQLVRARESVQGMQKGAEYRVVGVKVESTAFGEFVTYGLSRDPATPLPAENRPLFVVNGHFVLEAVVKITISNLTEDEVVSATAMLDEKGFEYDVDYTTLYAAKFAIVGLTFSNAKAAALVIERYIKEPTT